MADICKRCHLPHAPAHLLLSPNAEVSELEACLDAQATAMKQLLKRISSAEPRDCTCGAKIFMVRHSNGAIAPTTEAGLIHFVDCPNRQDFARKVR